MWTLLLLAATVRSFAHMPLGISDRNTIIERYIAGNPIVIKSIKCSLLAWTWKILSKIALKESAPCCLIKTMLMFALILWFRIRFRQLTCRVQVTSTRVRNIVYDRDYRVDQERQVDQAGFLVLSPDVSTFLGNIFF